MDQMDLQKRFEEAFKLLTQETTTREKFESVRTLIKGYNSKIDSVLVHASTAFSAIEKLGTGEIVELGAETLPEGNEEEKRRKKAILAFTRYYKDLKSEVERVRNELSDPKNQGKQIETTGKIIKYAKGPLGLITIAAFVIVLIFGLANSQKPPAKQTQTPVNKTAVGQQIQVIVVGDKKIPLSQVHSWVGPECDQKPHYHANTNHTAVATDGTMVHEADPTGCGFGKVEDVKLETVNLP